MLYESNEFFFIQDIKNSSILISYNIKMLLNGEKMGKNSPCYIKEKYEPLYRIGTLTLFYTLY